MQQLTTVLVRGAVFGGVFGATDAALQGKPGEEVLAAALTGGLLGAVFGPLTQVKFLAPVIVAVGVGEGFAAALDAAEQGNWGLAAFRAAMVLVGLQTFVDQPVPSGGRLGTSDTRIQLQGLSKFLQKRGWKIKFGGGAGLPEEYLPGSGPGTKGGNFLDLTAEKNGVTLRINTIDTLSDGLTPTSREAAAAAMIRSKIGPNDPFLLIPKWSLPLWLGQ